MKILFLHGLESGPNGSKVKHLAERGCDIYAPKLPKESFSESIRIAQDMFDAVDPDYVVGSSRGGAIAMAIDSQQTSLVLIAPAWKKYNVSPQLNSEAVVLHSADDDVIPLGESYILAAPLHICGESHRMSDKDALDTLCSVLKI
jgi:hypothetical protein